MPDNQGSSEEFESPPTRNDANETPDVLFAEAVSSGIPEKIGRYKIIKILGEGGFGRVYLGKDEGLERLVAIKVPRADRISRPEDVKAYLIEARNLARLDHPGIVKVFDLGQTEDGLPYVVSEFIEGSDLHDHKHKSRLSHDRSAEIVAAIAEALHYAHT